MVVVYLVVEFYSVVLILVFAHGPSPLLALTGQGIDSVRPVTGLVGNIYMMLYEEEATELNRP